MRNEANGLVAFVKNIEVYISGAIIVSLLMIALNFQVNNNIIYSHNNSTNSIVEIDITKLEKKDEEKLKTINLLNEKYLIKMFLR